MGRRVLLLARLMALVAWLAASLTAATEPAAAQDPVSKPELIAFPSGDLELKGFIWKPPGAGPFPAILWNHGSEKKPGAVEPVAPLFVAHGYVFFVPHRRGQGRSPGPYIMDQLNAAGSPAERSRMLVKLHEVQLRDQLAALSYLQGLSFVNPQRLAVMGASFGGIQTMLAAERGQGYRVAVNCSGAAQTWGNAPDLQRRLIAAARGAAMPVFFLQARNDYDLTPNRVLSEQVRSAGKPVESKVYPSYGSGARDGHSFCARGVDVWGADVLRFIEAHTK
jgi:carboxymethylenebutenolidase